MKNTARFIIIALSLAISSCSSKPVSKEPSDAEINAEAAKAYAEVKSKSKISTNAEWNAVVQRVASRIASASGENFQWEYVLLENPEVNAWCMPGGKIAVYTGIMPVLKDEAALAAVLGHEVAHAVRRHGRQQYARAKDQSIWAGVVGIAGVVGGQLFCKTDTCKLLSAGAGVLSATAVAMIYTKFSRQDETEADKFGQIYMARAGYDPGEAVHLWERMSEAMKGKAPPEWLSTHPSDEHRRANLVAWLPEAKAVYAQAPQHYGLGQVIR